MADLAKLTQAEREDFEERAAIMEYMGGMSRERTEREAMRVVRDCFVRATK